MSRYIDVEAIEKTIRKRVYAIEVEDILAEIASAPSIDLDDYVPRDYYEKVVEELCRKHTEEIEALMVERASDE